MGINSSIRVTGHQPHRRRSETAEAIWTILKGLLLLSWVGLMLILTLLSSMNKPRRRR